MNLWPITALAAFLAMSPHVRAGDVLVLGGTGRLGSEVVKELRSHGHKVTVLARPASNRSKLQGLTVSFLTGDLSKPEQIIAAFQNRKFDAVIDASARRAEDKSYDHATAMAALVAAAKPAGIRQVILFSSVGAGENINKFPNIPWGEFKPFLVERGKAENALMTGGIPYTIIRTGHVPQDESEPKTGTAKLTEDQSAFGSTTRPDLASLAVACLLKRRCFNKVYHAVDPGRKPPV